MYIIYIYYTQSELFQAFAWFNLDYYGLQFMKPPSLGSDSNLIIVKKVQYEKEVQVQKELQPSRPTEWLYKNLLFQRLPY